MTNCIISLHLLDALKINRSIQKYHKVGWGLIYVIKIWNSLTSEKLSWSTDFISGTRWNFEGKPGLILRKYWPTSNITLRKIIFFLKWNNITLLNSSLECLNMLRDGSVEEEILITIQQADDTGAVVCGGSNHLQSVSTLKVRLDHFVVLPIT